MGCGASQVRQPFGGLTYLQAEIDLLKLKYRSDPSLINAAPGQLMAGGVIKLQSIANLFPFSPLPDHTWLQGRMTPDEWTQLIQTINDGAIQGAVNQVKPNPRIGVGDFSLVHRKAGLDRTISNLRPIWMEKGIDLTIFGTAPVILYVKIIPIGSTPVSEPAAPDPSAVAPPTYTQTTNSQPTYAPQTTTSTVAPFCAQCGAAGQEGKKFCSQCGNPN